MRTHPELMLGTAMVHVLAPSNLCALCGGVVSGRDHAGVCPVCRRDLVNEQTMETFFLEDLLCGVAGEYGGVAKRALEAVKRGGNRRLLPLIAETFLSPVVYTLTQIVAAGGDPPVDGIVPVPASFAGRRQRGFDQVRLLSLRLDLPMYPILRRRRGAQQKRLSREARQINAVHRYRPTAEIGKQVTPGTRVIIVDDIVTTGASLRRCRDILREAGVEPVAAAACLITR
ncbi:MAG: ComF family protein [Alkalispirochaeta sp.]